MLARLALRFRTTLPFTKKRVADWHSRPGASLRLNPSWNRINNLAIETHIDAYNGRTSWLEDRVQCIQPSVWLPARWTEKKLHRLFAYRHRVIAHDLGCITSYAPTHLTILITGATGLVGSELTAFLRAAGHTVLELSRTKEPSPNTVWWNPEMGQIDLTRLEGVDAVFHLAGETIAGRWSAEKKRRIRDSRVKGTQHLVEALLRLKTPPKAFLCASAVGVYGDQGATILKENSPVGSDFLAEVCQDWEAAARHYTAGRVANLRFGIILSPAGGALSKMTPPFRLGVGGCIGSGEQYMSWIAMDDVLYQCYHVLMTPSIEGPVNLVSPLPVTNQVFTQILGRTLHRPTLMPLPTFAVNLAFGEMGRTTLLASQRASPGVLQKTGSKFSYPELDQTLAHMLC